MPAIKVASFGDGLADPDLMRGAEFVKVFESSGC
jgi:hypothetical protein